MRHRILPGSWYWGRTDLAGNRLALAGAGSASKLKPEDARCGVVDCVGGGNLGEGIGDARGDARGDDSSSTMIASKSACSSSSPSNEGRGDTLGDTRGDVPGPHASKRAPRWWSSVRGEVTFLFCDERDLRGDGDRFFGTGEKKASTPEGASTSSPSTSRRWGVSSASTWPQVGSL